MDRRVWRPTAGLWVSISLVLVGCSGAGAKHGVTQPAKVQTGGTLVAVGPDDPNGFNQKTPKATISGQIVMAKVWPSVWRLGPDSRYVLDTDLMVSAELTSTDPETAVYKINPHAQWSDGVPIDAEDFIYNWQMSRPGAIDVDGSPVQSVGSPGVVDPIASVTSSDGGKTVTAVFRGPYRPWQAQFNLLVPAHIGRRVGWNSGFDQFDLNVVISGGPFRIASYNPGKDLTLVPNEHYWGTRPNLDRLVLRYTSLDDDVNALRNGEVDVADLFGPDSDLVARFQGLPGVKTDLTPGPSQEYVGFNFRNELLAVPEVRRGFAVALDRPTILQRALGRGSTVGVVNSHLLTDRQPAYRDTSGGRYDRADVSAAKRLLEDSGFRLGSDGVYARDGKRLSFRVRTDSTNPTRVAEEELVQAQARQAGIELRIDNAPLNTLLPQLQKGDYDVEVLQYPKNAFGTVATFRTGNRWAFTDPGVDALVVQATAELDDGKWQGIVDQLDSRLWEDMPIVPLFQVPRLLAVDNRAANVQDNANSTLGPFWDAERWAVKAAR